jgi:neutral ceramidase
MSYNVRAGVARIDITPPIGINMVGYYIREGASNGVERPLLATALVLEAGSEKIAILSCDVIFIQNPHAAEIRARIAAAIGTKADRVIISCSHTHCGPSLPGFVSQDEQQTKLQWEYLQNLKNLLLGVATAANADLQAARLDSGSGASRIGINRREKDETGKVFLGEVPDGPMDTEVGVVRVDDPDGRPIAVLYNYGCHTVTMGPKCLKLSPDFVGPCREVIEEATGAKSLFLQGAAGNINPATGIGMREDDSENMTRLGLTLGSEVLRVMMEIRTYEKRGPRQFLASLAKMSQYPYVPVESMDATIAVRSEQMGLPMLALPSIGDARRMQQERHARVEAARREGKGPGMLTVLRHFADWSDKLCRTIEAGDPNPTIPFEVTALRIGDTGMMVLPCEPLAELSLAVKAASPLPRTLFLGYANGCIGYLSPADAYPEGGWSPWETYNIPDMLFQSYQLPMALQPHAAQTVVERSIALLHEVAGRGVGA